MPITMNEFKKIVRETMENLPKDLEPYLQNLIVEVAEEPTREQLLDSDLTEAEINAGDSALGLFEPLPLSDWMTDAYTEDELPHRLWIFKKPHEEEFPEREQLLIEIRKTVIHELAHHFGWTDRDLEAFDSTPNPFADGRDFPPRDD
jgi:predicted Zn-dependent protease with MMP-like domain